MRTTRTYYEILGLPRDATLAQIKRRYKQLVRKYHPDVATDKATAHRLFIQVREAYEALSDPVRRRAYDATLNSQRTAPSATRQAGPGPSRAQAPRPTATPLSKHIKDAQFAFIQKRFGEAATQCKAALELDPRNAQAHAILGDVYRAQGKPNSATRHYGYALQFNPNDRESEKKLVGMVGKRMTSATDVRPTAAGPATMMTLNMIWWGIAFFLILMIWVHPGKPIDWLAHYVPPVSRWSWSLVGLMAGSSAIVGMMLSVNGLLQHPDNELVFDASGGNWAVIPTGLILLIGSGFFFLGAAGFYILAGSIQSSLSRSVLIVFVAVVAVVGLSSLAFVPEARRQVLLFGGNVSFLSMLFGWYVGSMFKPMDAT